MSNAKNLPYDQTFPIILPNTNEPNTKALIRQIHTDNLHCSKLQTFYMTHQRYHILGGKSAINRVVNCCIPCQRSQKTAPTQRIGELPAERLEVTPPFMHTGLDCWGPVPVKHGGRGTHKRWVLICTCFVTRGITLYPLKDMTTSTIVNALTKHVNQFPTTRHLYSDKGSNFVGADREIRESVRQWDKNELTNKLTTLNLTWTFGPANCGHAGGIWERFLLHHDSFVFMSCFSSPTE